MASPRFPGNLCTPGPGTICHLPSSRQYEQYRGSVYRNAQQCVYGSGTPSNVLQNLIRMRYSFCRENQETASEKC